MTAISGSPPVHERRAGQAVYYAGWVTMLVVESVIWAFLGFALGAVAFFVGGVAWALWQARQTELDERLRGPILGGTDRLVRHGSPMLLGVAVFLAGAPGVAAAATASGRPRVLRLIVASSALYTGFWLLFHLLRPSAGLPMHLWPALPGR